MVNTIACCASQYLKAVGDHKLTMRLNPRDDATRCRYRHQPMIEVGGEIEIARSNASNTSSAS